MAEIKFNKIQIGVINASNFVKKYLNDHKLIMQDIVDALQEQVTEHFRPAWGIDAELKVIHEEGPIMCTEMCSKCTPPPESWWLLILDNSDEAGILGYRDTTPEGLPLAKVFAETASRYGLPWTVTASHELLEMLADPGMSLTAFDPTNSPTEASGRLYAYEICDPCGDDKYTIGKKKIEVANFVHPTWFQWFQHSKWSNNQKTRFTHKNDRTVTEPFQLQPGGQISVLDMLSGSGWYQIFGNEDKIPDRMRYYMRARVGSRRERRRMVAHGIGKSERGGAGPGPVGPRPGPGS